MQKQKNYALQDMPREEFVKLLASNLPTPPQYFFHDAAQNRKWQTPLKEFVTKSQKPLNYKQFVELVNNGCKILDTRDDLSQGIVQGSYNIQFGGQFASWVGTLFKPQDKIILISEPGHEDLTIIRMARIGYYNVLGYLQGGFNEYKA